MAGTRYSHQRELIYGAVCSRRDHPTAEMVFSALKPDNPSLSLGTVYRNLNLLVQEGRLVRMPFPVERYDAELRPHNHFCCEKCGAVSDLNLPYDPRLDGRPAEQGHLTSRHELTFYGVCRRCREKEPEQGEE